MKLKKTLAILMVLAMLVVGAPITAIAAGGVCSIGGVSYSSINEAVAAAQDGDVINVTSNTTVSEKMTIAKKIELTSTNGSEITVSVAEAFNIGSGYKVESTPGDVTVSGNLKITASKATMFYVLSGTITIKDNVYLKCNNSQYVLDSEAAGQVPAYMNIYGGTLESTSPANDKGTIFFGGKDSVLNITGGKIIQNQANSYVIKMRADHGKVNISGGHLKAVNNTIAVYDAFAGKEVNISGGTVEATGESVIKMFSKCDYLTVNVSGNAVLKAKEKTLKISSPMSTVNVTGGTIIATNNTPVDMRYGTLNVTGGKFILEGGDSSSVMVKSAYSETEFMTGTVNINGGLFINKNATNTKIMTDITQDTNPINYNGGKILYKSNVTSIMENKLEAPKTVEVTYEGEKYNVYSRSAGADKKYAGTMNADESIRFADGSTGLRFVASFSKSAVSSLASQGTVTYGMIIVPVEYVAAADSFTVEALTAKYGANGYLNIACAANKGVVTNADGSVTVQAAIVNVKAENYDTAFAAVAYACVNGQYYYTAFDQNANSATVKDVAAAALADTTATYTDAQKTVLNAFAG